MADDAASSTTESPELTTAQKTRLRRKTATTRQNTNSEEPAASQGLHGDVDFLSGAAAARLQELVEQRVNALEQKLTGSVEQRISGIEAWMEITTTFTATHALITTCK